MLMIFIRSLNSTRFYLKRPDFCVICKQDAIPQGSISRDQTFMLCISRMLRRTIIYFCIVIVTLVEELYILCVGRVVRMSCYGGGFVAYLFHRLWGVE